MKRSLTVLALCLASTGLARPPRASAQAEAPPTAREIVVAYNVGSRFSIAPGIFIPRDGQRVNACGAHEFGGLAGVAVRADDEGASGYTVDLVDVSRVALTTARAEAARRKLRSVNFLQLDLDDTGLEADSYDLICVFRFLSRALIPPIRAAVRPGGRILYQTFNTRYRALKPNINPDYLLGVGELAGFFGDWKILRVHEPDHISQIVAIKPEPPSAD